MSYIPEGMTIKNIRQLLSKFGDVERIYLERDNKLKKNPNASKRNIRFNEGWIEFKKKSVAKFVAQSLNGALIGGKRRTKFHDAIWSLKYLKR